MNYADTNHWPDVPVDEVPRDEIATVYSFGHYDGPGTGVVRWRGEHWYARRFGDPGDREDRYWIIRLTPDQQVYALEYGAEWARLFHSGMSWNADGTHAPERDGIYAHRPSPRMLSILPEGRKVFDDRFPSHPEPDPCAEVVGYFAGWRT